MFLLLFWEIWFIRKIFFEWNFVVGGVIDIGESGREVDGVLGGEKERERGKKKSGKEMREEKENGWRKEKGKWKRDKERKERK